LDYNKHGCNTGFDDYMVSMEEYSEAMAKNYILRNMKSTVRHAMNACTSSRTMRLMAMMQQMAMTQQMVTTQQMVMMQQTEMMEQMEMLTMINVA
jgi:hypothetical protein